MRKVWLVILALLIFSVVSIAQPQPVGEIVDLKGEVFINHKPAEIGMEIYEKDTVGTQKGETEIVFEKGRIYLGEYTQVRVANLYPLEIEVWHGEILTLFLEPVAITTPHQKFFLEGTWRVVVDPYQTHKYRLLEEREECIKEEHHYYRYPYRYPLRTGWWYPYWGGWLRIGWWWNWWYWHPYWSYWSYRWYRYGYYRGYRYNYYSSRISRRQLKQRVRYRTISKPQLRVKTRSYSRLKTSGKSFLANKTPLRTSSFRTSRSSFRIKRIAFRSSSFRRSRSYSRIKIRRK